METKTKSYVARYRNKMDKLEFDPEVWGKHYWFFLHSIAETYPEYPNDITKRKYYDLIINMPLFIPHESIGNKFATLLDKYPVSPYLVCRDSFRRWVNFIHNKINFYLGKEEIPLHKGIELYYLNYSNNLPTNVNIPFFKKYATQINIGIILSLIFAGYVFTKEE